MTKKPTRKQKKAVEILSENVGMPLGTAMREAGYSESTSLTPQRLTESKGWQGMIDTQLPDEHLLSKHRQFLDEPKKITSYHRGELDIEIEEWTPTAVKALDMAYKLKGSYAPEKSQRLQVNINSQKTPDSDLEVIRKEFDAKLKAKYIDEKPERHLDT